MQLFFNNHWNECSYNVLCTLLISMLLLPEVSSSSLTASFPVSQEEEEICGSTDIRNSVDNFEKLRNCTVIEGFLQIVLIDRGESEAYTKLHFPKLREITDYLFLYRVANLSTLANIFPNLSVIRGAKLFHNYALVIYQLLQLQEIGLPSLTTIVRGSVHVTKNPQLCYVATIDWDEIAKSGKGGHFINGNKDSNQCPNCPQHQKCPVKKMNDKTVKLCWNRFHCQRVCHCTNGACNDNGECCHEECLGGCNGQGPGNCSACKRFVWKGMCKRKCPFPTKQFADRRCVTDAECLNMSTNTTGIYSSQNTVRWKLFNNTCLDECPDGYMADERNTSSCRKCNGTCPIECPSAVVDSIAAAQLLKHKGCTRITGHLEIQIRGGTNIVRELEENLMLIKEVDDFVKIVHSHTLISLNFLKNLRKIHGKNQNNNYSLWVFDNDNLQELVPINVFKKLEIVTGGVYFHFNPKLCPSTIDTFLKHNGITKWTDSDVSSLTNGDKVACTVHPLKVHVRAASSTAAVVVWQNFQTILDDHRTLLSYVISYKEAPFRNISVYSALFEGRDACGGDSWKTEDIDPTPTGTDYKKTDDEKYLLLYLNPFTQYALYIKTYTTAKEEHGAQSDIVYFQTLPDIPSSPVDVNVRSTEPSMLEISWKPPHRPNGNITHYIVRGYYQKYDQEYLFHRDYCESPLEIPEHAKSDSLDQDKSLQFDNKTNWYEHPLPGKCCACPKEKPELKNEDKEYAIDFEDAIHNYVYVRRENISSDGNEEEKNISALNNETSRRKRSITEKSGENYLNDSIPTSTAAFNNVTTLKPNVDTQPEDNLEFDELVNMSTKIVVKNLRHFSDYTIEIVACQDYAPKGKKFCSQTKAIANARTAPLDGADNINSSTISVEQFNSTSDQVNITWEAPVYPNGLVVTYRIEYKHLNIDKFKITPICITQKEYEKNKGYVLRNLQPGNYSLRLQATSLAGDGNWTHPVKFTIVQETSAYSLLQPGVSTKTVILAAVLGSVVLVILGVVITYYIVKRRMQKIPNDILYASVNPEYMTTIYEPDEWEIPRNKITLIRELGQGSFGMVYEGIAKGVPQEKDEIKCAVKTVNESAALRERVEFLNEASVMKTFKCHHVLKLLGVVSIGQPTLVVMELMALGDLKSYLRSHRPDLEDSDSQLPPTLKRILQMAGEIADGMAYLAVKKFVHRDLAARNCMVAEDLTVKIGDFGMTRDVYETDYYRKGGKGLLPVRWMAPESLKDGVFTSQSDVWSYGIVIWEMATLASQPYLGLSNEQVLKYVIDGGIMKEPEHCPKRLYSLMNDCWKHNPNMRPNFLKIVESLIDEVSPKFHEVSFYSSRLSVVSLDVEEENEDEPSPSTPLKKNGSVRNDLRTGSHETDDSDNDSVEMKSLSSGRDYCSTKDVESNHAEIIHSNDGSKGSKISDYSLNGGLANGHVNLPYSNHA